MASKELRFFGTDGFRGRVNEQLTVRHAFLIGRALGFMAGKGSRVLIGKDTRLSCYMLESALASGLTASGADAHLMHVTTTPSVSYIVRAEKYAYGVMISASHNPYMDNGIKLFAPGGEKMPDDSLRAIEEILIQGDAALPLQTGADIGKSVDAIAARNRYMGYLISLAVFSPEKLRIGLDCANGSTYQLARGVMEALGAEVFSIGDHPSGVNINDACGSTHMDALCELVRANNLDIGFAFDGDGDRCLCADEQGAAVDGDQILYLYAAYMKRRGKLEKNAIAATVMSNPGLAESLRKLNIDVLQTDVGDRYVDDCLRENGLLLGGEQSGHIIFRKYARTGDGILTALKVLQVMLDTDKPLSQLAAPMTKYPQVTLSIPVSDRDGALKAPDVKKALEESKAKLGEKGRILLRKSGTERVVRVLCEAPLREDAQRAAQRVAQALQAFETVNNKEGVQ